MTKKKQSVGSLIFVTALSFAMETVSMYARRSQDVRPLSFKLNVCVFAIYRAYPFTWRQTVLSMSRDLGGRDVCVA